ncbi:restriction endonuclease subunit S [Sorangium sp. So ce1335]|uniref:restriction endonuclease subunit S n=1 Tax=Sorangium sp. So ce1335 TaxID=3133335 RepID=UPI003F60AC28
MDGDTIVSTVRTYLRAIAYIERPPPGFVCSTGFAVVTPGRRICSKYLYYWLRSEPVVDEICARSVGVSYPAVNADELGSLPVPIPRLEQQIRIVDFLDRSLEPVDELIAKKERLLGLLRENRKALIAQVVTNGLAPEVPFQDSGLVFLGKCPKHWPLLRLKHISPRISGRLVYQPAQYFADEGVPFLMGNNVTERGIDWADVRRIPVEVNERFARHALREGDVVTVRVGAPGVTCVVPREADGLNCGSLMIVRRSEAFDSRWLAYVMNSPVVRSQIELVQYGAAQEQINITDAVNFLVPVPPLEEQRRIADLLDEKVRGLDMALSSVRQSMSILLEYRQALISAAVVGKLDVTKDPPS